MTQQAKLAATIVLALIFSVVLSVKPLYRIFPALLNESLSIAFWMLLSAWVLLRHQSSFKWLLSQTQSALVFSGVFLGVLVVQYALGYSAPYGGYVGVHAGAALACILAILGGAASGLGEPGRSTRSYVLMGIGLFLVALVQSGIGWLQFVELHLSFSWIALQGFGGRAFGNLRQYNLFALLMLLGLLALALLIERKPLEPPALSGIAIRKLPRSSLVLMGVYALALTLTGTLVASISRFGMLMCAFFVILAYADFRAKHTRRALFFLSLPFMYLGWYLIFFQLDQSDLLLYYGTQRAISVEVLSAERNSDRLEIWNVAIQLIKAYPWFGLGYGQLPHYSAVEVLGWNFYLILDYAHNFFLQWALDFGLPVACLLLLLLFSIAWQLRTWLKDSNGRILFAMLLFPVLHEIVEFPLHYPTFLMPWCFLLGYMLASREGFQAITPEPEQSSGKKYVFRANNVCAATLCAAVAVLSVYAIYDSAKAGQLFQPEANIAPYKSIQLAYTSVAFEHIADYAVIQTVPITRENAAQLRKLSTKVSKLRFDINVALIFMQANALDGRMCVAKSMAYRLANSDDKSKKNLLDKLAARTEPEFRTLEAFALKPYSIEWQPDRVGDC